MDRDMGRRRDMDLIPRKRSIEERENTEVVRRSKVRVSRKECI